MKYLAIILSLFITACDSQPTADSLDSKAQSAMTLEATREAGMPNVTHYAERKALKMILELRDRDAPTWTYRTDMNGKYHLVCPSIGFPIPYATQYTNPMRIVWPVTGSFTTLPQADPNSLFMPSSADATFIRCINYTTGKVEVAYSEDKVNAYSHFRRDAVIDPPYFNDGGVPYPVDDKGNPIVPAEELAHYYYAMFHAVPAPKENTDAKIPVAIIKH
jgi:hypothetical protein